MRRSQGGVDVKVRGAKECKGKNKARVKINTGSMAKR